MQFSDIQALTAEDMAGVDRVIREKLHSDVALVAQVSEHIIAGGGKRLRPLLHVLMAKALGYAGQDHLVLASVLEFIHTATLLHDDVVDGSQLRRGQATANEMFGIAAAVLVGDFVYSRAFQMMVSVNSMRVMEVLADATNVIAEGEVLQLMNCRDPEVDEARYLQVIRYKTARLFEASTRLAAILSNTAPDLEEALAQYGAHLGTAFQVIDDVLDYSGESDALGKNLGDDLAEGKVTLPLIEVMRVGTPEEAALVRQAILEPERALGALPAILEAIERTGALEKSRAAARREANAAVDNLTGLAEGKFKAALVALARLSVDRSH